MIRRRCPWSVLAAVVAVACLVLSACGMNGRTASAASSTSPARQHTTSNQVPSADCPHEMDKPASVVASGKAGANPRGGQLCEIPFGGRGKVARSSPFDARAAAVLWAVFTDPAMTAHLPPGCTGAKPDVVAIFDFAGGTRAWVPVVTLGCTQPFAVVGSRVQLLDLGMGQAVFDEAGSDVSADTSVPELFGDSAAQAVAAARRAGIPLMSTGQERVDGLPVGTVVAQTPMPGASDITDGAITQIEIETVVHSAPACRPGDLAFTYYAGGAATGNAFGSIRIRNLGSAWCQLHGPVGIVGVDSSGARDTQRLSYRVAPDLELSPRAAVVEPGQAPSIGVVTAMLQIAANYRDDPTSANGLCDAGRVIPAMWQVSIAGTSTMLANRGADTGHPQFNALPTCRGQLDTPSLIGFG